MSFRLIHARSSFQNVLSLRYLCYSPRNHRRRNDTSHQCHLTHHCVKTLHHCRNTPLCRSFVFILLLRCGRQGYNESSQTIGRSPTSSSALANTTQTHHHARHFRNQSYLQHPRDTRLEVATRSAWSARILAAARLCIEHSNLSAGLRASHRNP